jgi:hypothetical protein
MIRSPTVRYSSFCGIAWGRGAGHGAKVRRNTEHREGRPVLKHKLAVAVGTIGVGTTLYFVCAVHPWMQAKLIVTQ